MFSKDNFAYLCKNCGTQNRKAGCPAHWKICRSCKGLNHYSVGDPNKIKYLKNCDYKNKSLPLHSLSQNVTVDSVFSKNRQASWINKIQVGQKAVDFKLGTDSDVIVLPNSILSL